MESRGEQGRVYVVGGAAMILAHSADRATRDFDTGIDEGVDPATGKDKRRWHPAGDNRKDAERILADLIKRVHDGDYRSPDKITLGDYMLKRWLLAKRARLKPSTAESYEAHHPPAHQPQHRTHPRTEAAARGPRHALCPAAHRRQAQRRRGRPLGPIRPQRPHHHPGRALRRRAQRNRGAQRRRPRRCPHHQPQQPNHERVDQRRAAGLPGRHLRPLPLPAVPAGRNHRHAPSRTRRTRMAQRRPRHSQAHRQPATAIGGVHAHRERPQDPHQPPHHRPRRRRPVAWWTLGSSLGVSSWVLARRWWGYRAGGRAGSWSPLGGSGGQCDRERMRCACQHRSLG